jgi:hypothetical protein
MDLEIQYSSSKLRAATFGRGVYETDLMITDIKNQQQNNFVVNIYPNPANNFIKIATSGAFDAGNLFYELYNSYGEVISRNTISTNVKELDLSNLTAGIYILKIQDNNRSVIQKVILE